MLKVAWLISINNSELEFSFESIEFKRRTPIQSVFL